MYREMFIVLLCCVSLQCAIAVGEGCEDHHPKCIQWASKGECDKNPTWMLRHCRMSCGQCSVANVYELVNHANSEIKGSFKIFLVIFGALFAAIVTKMFFHGASCDSTAKLEGQTVIITGGNTGIGKETARNLAWRKARVILACRDMSKGVEAAAEIMESTRNENIEVKKLDLASFKSIRKFADEVLEEEEKINILINNAGYLGPKMKTKDNMDTTFQVNYLGPFLLTHLLLDKIKASSPSRIINVASVQHRYGQINFEDLNGEKKYGKFNAYNQSKLALVMFTRQLAEKLRGTKVTVNSLHPGVVSTEIFRNFLVYRLWIFRPLLSVVCYFFFKTTTQGAQTTIHCAVTPELENITGQYFKECNVSACSKGAEDDGIAKKLWEVSERLCGLNTAN